MLSRDQASDLRFDRCGMPQYNGNLYSAGVSRKVRSLIEKMFINSDAGYD